MSCPAIAGGNSRCNSTIYRPVHTCGAPDREQDAESLHSSGITERDFKP